MIRYRNGGLGRNTAEESVHGRNVPVDELACTDADLADSIRLGRVIQSLLDRGVLHQLTRYERSLQRNLVSTLKLYHETQEARRERMKTTNGVPVDVPKTDRWIEGPDGRVTEAIDPPDERPSPAPGRADHHIAAARDTQRWSHRRV